MKLFLFAFFTSCHLFCFSQDNDFSIEHAKTLYYNGNYQGVINYHLDANKSTINIERLNLIVQCYSKLEDYYKEIEYQEKIIQINNEARNYSSLVTNYIDIAKVYGKLKKREHNEMALTYLTKALTVSKTCVISDQTLNRIHNNIANKYRILSKKEKALEHFNKSLHITKKNKDSVNTARTYSNIATIYISPDATKEDLNKAKHYLNLAKKSSTKPPVYLYTYAGITDYLLNDFKGAITNHNKAIKNLTKINIEKPENLPNIESIKDIERKGALLNILFEKTYAWIKYAEQKNNPQHLKEGLKTIELSDKILDLLFIETKEEKTKINWRRRAKDFYFLGVHVSHLLNNNDKAFYFSEKNKALLLLNNASITKLNNNINLPDSLKNKEIAFKKEIYQLESLVEQDMNLDSLKNKLFETKLDFDYFLKSLKKEFPKYIENNKVQPKVLSLKAIQNKIKDTNECYFSYIWNKTENQFDRLYGIAVTKDSTISFKIDDLKGFNDKVLKFKTVVAKAFVDTKEKEDYQKVTFSLYNDLFPLEIRPLIKNKKLIIIPDSDLSNIPFEALVTKPNTNNYLIKNHEISYAYSLSFLTENNTLKRNTKKDFIGFAPITFNYDNLDALNRSETEIKNIETIINGDAAIDLNANKQKFFSEINNYKIIHLSTHANANDSIAPWIAFKNEKLYLNELYTKKNQADLVVLSACNSSLGKLKDGEGVFSLARGFFYSGANSVMSSLWNVNDKSNTTITTSFYSYLKNGETKSASLRLAKLDYLNTHTLSEASPYYWSSLILIGDSSTISFNNYWQYYIILGIILIAILVLVLKKYYSK